MSCAEYKDAFCDEEKKACSPEPSPDRTARSPAHFKTVRSAGRRMGGGMFMKMLAEAKEEVDLEYNEAVAKEVHRKLAEELHAESAAVATADAALARRLFDEEAEEVKRAEEAERLRRWQEEERVRREADEAVARKLQAEYEAERRRLVRQNSATEAADEKLARKMQRGEAEHLEKAVEAIQRAWREPVVRREGGEDSLRFEVELPAVDRVTAMLDEERSMVCLKVESHKFAAHEEVAGVALKKAREVLGKRNCFTLDVELEGGATVRPEGISYYYDNGVVVLILKDPTLRDAEMTAAGGKKRGARLFASLKKRISEIVYSR